MKTGWIKAAMIVTFALSSATGIADEQKIGKANNKEDFAAVVAAVKHELQPGGRYEFVRGKDLDSVNQRLDEMSALFDRFGTVDKMDQGSRISLYNDQEAVDGILTRDDSKREVCQREASLGSHITHVTCRTYGEIRRGENGVQSTLRQMDNIQQQNRTLTESPAQGPNVSH